MGFNFANHAACHSFQVVNSIVLILQIGVLAGSAQTSQYLFTGSEITITLHPGTYDITAYGAQGGPLHFGAAGGLGARMEGLFHFTRMETLTILVGGGGGGGTYGYINGGGGGGGGGSFVVKGTTPIVIAGGGGGGSVYSTGRNGRTGPNGDNGGGSGGVGGSGGNGGSGGVGGGGGGFYNSGGKGFGAGGSYDGFGGSSFHAGGNGGAGGFYGGGGDGGFGGGGGGGLLSAGGGGGYSGGGGGGNFGLTGESFGGGGGSIIDSSATMVLARDSGIASPHGSPNGEVIIIAIPEPTVVICNDPGVCGAVYTFLEGSDFACSPPSGSLFPIGTTTVTCIRTSPQLTYTFTITVRDCESPVIQSITATPASLWPPNRKMQPVTLRVSATDHCHIARSRIISVNSDEGTASDWQITGDLTLNLRAERSGSGNGRIYAITVQSADDAGNTATAMTHVVVSH